ncbi:GNAT family protein [Vibrio splendidus]|uniref:GNAT family N-acetyltransferase n=1 Tax=Vibrio splendidus TaxID=29497 RepID=UPI000C861927|nr:GNAT family protein [Vibrio splendidus]PMO98242.1 GNAT family N-acetyltransferase [Vibrio splendidus]PMP29713.1 GNAT family N-acetyltransferase [Vibrio splendidus]PMP36312.1 GNAT family N-acetyltransferase [Vibrio splendidus]PMP46045.1 GNAT family N-acetyltransferase [Vibrio splendidus]PMP48801.1 GNAT family N-acetyltransferase [Vibrio splendidus]
MKVNIRPANENELELIHSQVISNDEWTKFNGPYFPYSHPTLDQFENISFQHLLTGSEMQLITVDDVPVGTVSCYWECEKTRWLEAGIVIYDKEFWGKGIAALAIPLWVSYLFKNKEIERVGLTTWSGNPRMMSLAMKLGFQQEARLRKVRYYKGEYYDSLKYGLLRSEWAERN